jgi:hypothetical protein
MMPTGDAELTRSCSPMHLVAGIVLPMRQLVKFTMLNVVGVQQPCQLVLAITPLRY